MKTTYPVLTIPVPETEQVSDPDLATALAMTGADIAHGEELGYTGEGIKVAVMDTGVDYDHPDLGGDPDQEDTFPTERVPRGYDFVGDAFNANDANSKPEPDKDPDDCDGHGTHVAGIVGANGEVTGVAPDVTFGAYKVFGCEGTTSSDIMIAAMEHVLDDDMDVLNMSIGAPFQWPQYPTAQASDRLVKQGVSVVASIGNSGANGLYAAGAPGVGERVIGVASFENSHETLSAFSVSPDNALIGYGLASGAPPPPTSGTFPLARTGTATSTDDACNNNAPSSGSLTGKVALIRRGGCTFYEKALNAEKAGAAGVIFYNNTTGLVSPNVAGDPKISIPVVAITSANGTQLDTRIAAGPTTMTWTDQTVTSTNRTGGLISGFSSYGLAADLGLKPDIGAPGGLIRSTWPLELGRYNTISGTSMASPHVAGGVALLLESRPNTQAQAVREILQNSADPKPWSGNLPNGFLDNVHRQGAGMLDIDDAILSKTQIDPAKLSLGESEDGSTPTPKTLIIKNTGSSNVTYNLSHAPALSTRGSTFTPSFTTGFASVAFSPPSVVVPAGGQATVDVTITANPALADRSQYGGYIVLTPQGGGQVYRVPYAGFKGDYQSIQALKPTAYNFPWLAKLINGNFKNQPDGATYTLQGDDIPYILVHLDHQVRRVKMEVEEVGNGESWQKALDEKYLPRNSTETGFFALPWDGVRGNGNNLKEVPNGHYIIHLSVVKALGDEANPAHLETWTSPTITIDHS